MLDDAGCFEPRQDERRVGVGRQHQHRQTFERHRRIAREPRQVGAQGQQQRVDAQLSHCLAHALGPHRQSGRAERIVAHDYGRHRCMPSIRSSTALRMRNGTTPWTA